MFWSPHLLGRDPRSWREPLEFRPERFFGTGTTAPSHAWMPFGAGACQCMGFGLALMQCTIVLARLAQRLDISHELESMPSPRGGITMHPDGGVPVSLCSVLF